ncbi:GYF domain-containing protein [Akkermansiaceae bacterium]|nr:GYF domain-containing protein [Akkermansiaceae bacterium]
MSEWYYGKGGQQEGPLDEAAMRARITAGQVAPSDLVWREGMAEWLPLSQVAELAASSAAAVPSAGSVPTASPYATPGTNPTGAPATPYAPAPPNSGLAIASLVLGILAILSSCMYVGILFGIPAVICGHMAMKRFANPENQIQGKGMAIAGLVCGYLGSLISLVIIGLVVFAFNAKDGVFKEAFEEAQRAQEESLERMEEAERQMEEAQENAQ